MSEIKEEMNQIPVVILRGLVIFPNTILSVDVSGKKSADALNFAMKNDRMVYVVTQKDVFMDNPENKDLYKIGCVARVKQLLKISDSIVKVIIEGLYRASHSDISLQTDFYVTDSKVIEETALKNKDVYIEAILRRIKTCFDKYAFVYQNIPNDIIKNITYATDVGNLCDYIASNISAPYDDKQYLLEQAKVSTRANIIIKLLNKEREIAEIDKKIGEKTKASIDQSQREYYLREQLRSINSELYGDDFLDEINEYHTRIDLLKATDSVKDILHNNVNKLSQMPNGSHEGTVVRGYLDTCLELPWNDFTSTNSDITKASKILDRDLFGMKKIKERILEMLSVYALSPDITGQIICLIGPPGVGKTSLGRIIAECMGRKFARISLGGIHDEAEIRGHRKTYIGAMPGKIITAIKQSGSSNPLILLDELDKLGSDYRGDPSAAMLEVLDPEQNSTFEDHYIEIPFDLSHTVFIATANSYDTIPAPLLDRMEIVELSGYTREEKFNIAKKHLVSKEVARHGLKQKQIRITDEVIYSLIDSYTREAGVRRLERCIAALCRKSAKRIATGDVARVVIKMSDVEKMLGKKKYKPEVILDKDEVGIINGLAWTSVGGEIMQLEIASMSGTGKVELTGSLGDVMKESAMAAVSYVRSNAESLGVNSDFYKTSDIHIHATEAAVPKDGPSAGVTITTGLVSALTGRPVKRDVAMTGEVTIRGRVLPIGGLREKSMAAYTGGVKTVFIPKDNVSDLDDVDEIVKENIEFIPVSNVNEIIDKALVIKSDVCVKNNHINNIITNNTTVNTVNL